MKNLTNEQALNGSSYKTANLLSDLDANFTEHEADVALLAPKANPTLTGTVTIPTPINDTDAANKSYVDLFVALGSHWVDPVEDIVAVLSNGIPLGDRYILSTDNHIYTSDGDNTWTDNGHPDTGTVAYVAADVNLPDNEVGHYNFNGTDWVYMGLGVSNHNDLLNQDGGEAAFRGHLTAAQHAVAIQASTNALNGYLSAADHTLFNAKAPTANPTFTGVVTVPNTSFTYSKLQNASANVVLGRSGAAGVVEELSCTAAGRALLDDATAADQKTTIGLGNVTNESKATMFANPTFTGTVSGITKVMVGLTNVDNTSDANKPISTATQTALNLKANLASPTLTGTPLAPTAAVGTNTTQIATTAFVQSTVGAGGQYTTWTDGVVTFRQGARNPYFVLDQTVTALGFAGVINTDWKNVRSEKLP